MTEPKRNPDLDVKFEIVHDLPIKVSEQTLHDLVTSAIESSCGAGHWARISVGKHQPGWANYFTATFVDCEEDNRKHTLSIEKLLKGLSILAEKYPHHMADILNDNTDATTGDVLVQCALLGDIVYG